MNSLFLIIPVIINSLPIIALAIAAVFAFKAQKNWATITFLAGIALYVAFTAFSFYQVTQILENTSSPNPSEYNPNFLIQEIMGYSIPFITLIGIAGFMYTSRSIHQQTIALREENQDLQHQLNQLNQN